MRSSSNERKLHVDKACSISVQRQCALLSLPRSSYYYKARGESAENLALMRLIDGEFLKHPWMGVPKMTQWLVRDKGIRVNHKRVQRLYKKLDIHACVPGIKTTKKGKGAQHKVFPYLLRDLEISGPNHVWAMDITYIPVQGGYFYLCAVIDLYTRLVVSWSISNSMDGQWCRDTLAEAVDRYGAPEILNTDQGSQFTSELFRKWVLDNCIKPSMDGKGRAIDNIFIERLWRSVKYEEVYLYGYKDGKCAYEGLKKYFTYYNTERRHENLDYGIPAEVYDLHKKKAA